MVGYGTRNLALAPSGYRLKEAELKAPAGEEGQSVRFSADIELLQCSRSIAHVPRSWIRWERM